MASQMFSASQVCQIVSGEDGDLDYVFTGSDDDLGMKETDEEDLENEVDSGEMDSNLYLLVSSGSTSGDEGSSSGGSESSGGGSGSGGGGSSSGGSGGGGSSGGGSGGARGRGGRGRGGVGGRGGGTGSCQATDRAAREYSWSDEGSSVTVHPFSMDVGPTIQLGDDPTDIFLRFFTPQLLDHIVMETNLFACQCLSSANEGEGPPPTWETNTEEIKDYLGFAILMGINRLPDLYDYWSTDEVFHYYPIASRIPRKRVLEIAHFLHCADNKNFILRGEPGHDRLAKVRPVIEFVRRLFLGNYNPHCENSIDETMIRFKGKSTLKKYMPKKKQSREASRCGEGR